ncbi:MAG: MFS transporter [Lactobacillus iners]|nr:MFS transporter [Lactobacillus iners]
MAKQSKKQLLLAVSSLGMGNLASSIFSFCLSLYTLQKTGSSLVFSTILLINPVIKLLFTPLVGYTVDKYHHKKIAIGAQLVSIVLDVIFLSLIELLSLNEQILLIALAVIGLSLADCFQETSYKASTKSFVAEEYCQKLIGYEQVVTAGTAILAPILGGVVFSWLELNWVTIIELIGEVVSLLLISMIDFYLVEQRQSSHLSSIKESFKAGINYIRQDKNLLDLLLFAVFANFSLGSIEVGLPVIMVKQLKLVLSKLNLNGAYLGFTGRNGVVLSIIFAIFAFIELVENIYLITFILGLGMFLIGGILTMSNLPFAMYLRTQVAEDYQGRVGSTMSSLVSLLSPISFAIFGLLFNTLASLWIFSFCGIILLIDSLFLLKNKHTS